MAHIFIAYDFEIKQGLISDFEHAQRNQPKGIEINWPGRPEGMSQGEIWRNIVRPAIDSASRFVAYVDLPNANVGFEIGYSLGHVEGKQVALARISSEIPAWLKSPPFNGFICPYMESGRDLLRQIQSDNWFKSSARPERGKKVLLLCPPRSGANFIDLIKNKYPAWLQPPEDGWSLNDMPEKLHGVGAVIWLIVPHREGEKARDGRENAAASVVAGFAQACGMHVKVLRHTEARGIADVAPQALEFGNEAKLLEHLERVAQELEALLAERPSEIAPEVPTFSRPDVGPPPELETTVLSDRFIGRERLLGDLADALRGLASRRAGELTEGGARVQAIWYHGFGGMGKSWFLRRAIVETRERLPSAKAALIDWDETLWRTPLQQPPENPKTLLEPIAHRIAQLYGVEALDPYWRIVQRTRDAEAERSRLRERFHLCFLDLQAGKDTDNALRIALNQKNLWAEGDQRRRNLEELGSNPLLWDEVFVQWFDNGGGKADDPEAVLRPDALRVNALQICMRAAASQHAPLVLLLDTCEVLSRDLDRWLRQLIAPLCDGKTPFLGLFGSRLAPDVGEPAGSRDVWRANVGEERWRSVAFDEGVRFTVQEIALALRKVRRPLTQPEELAERLHRITLGVPLALRSLLDLHEQGDTIVSELEEMEPVADEELDETSAETQVVETVADRFLLHLKNRQDRVNDFKDIIALSLLTEANREVLAGLWNTRNVRGRLRELSTRYSLLAVGDLHGTVRSFLRRRWRAEDRPPLVDEVIAHLVEVVDKIEFPGQPGEPEHMDALAIRLNARGWSEEGAALRHFAPAIALALAFDEHVPQFVNLAAEIRDTRPRSNAPHALRRLAKQLQDSPWWFRIAPWGSDEILAWLEAEESQNKWSSIEKGVLNLLRGLKYVSQGNHKLALEPLLSALEVLEEKTIPQQEKFGGALFDVGYALGQSRDSAEEAIRAYEGASRLKYSEAGCANNLGVLFVNCKRDAEAEAQYRKAMELDPRKPLYPRNLGNLFRELKRYAEAEQCYRQALELDPRDAATYNDLGRLFEALGRADEAEGQYRTAMELDPREPLYPRNLGDLFVNARRHEEAEHWYREAVNHAPNDAETLNNLAWFFYERSENLDEAEQLARQAVEIAPKNANLLHTLASIQLKHRGWNGAAEVILQWLRASEGEFIVDCREYVVDIFKAVLSLDKAAELASMLRRQELGSHWAPWAQAINSLAGAAPDQDLSDEVREIQHRLTLH